MAAVDPEFARWLKEGAVYAAADDAAIAAIFGALARVTEVMSPLALAAGADAEAARQLAFLAGPLVLEVVVVKGLRIDLIGCPVTLTGDRLGYEASPSVFVLGVEEHDAVELTTLVVLRKLI
jgi:hypothetical protein